MALLGLLIAGCGGVVASMPSGVFDLSIKRSAITPEYVVNQQAYLGRRGTVDVALQAGPGYLPYYANISVGTPAQHLVLFIDISAGDTWVNVGTSSYCSQQSKPCSEGGTYEAQFSATYSPVNGNF